MGQQMGGRCFVPHAAWILGASLVLVLASWAEAGPKKSDAVVKVSAQADKPAPDGQQVVTVTLAMAQDRPWHIYANPVPKDFPGVPTTITVGGKVKPEEVQVKYPEGQLVQDSEIGDYHVYRDQVNITVLVHRAPGEAGPLEIQATFQACWQTKTQGQTKGVCLLPATVKVMTP
jgi:DsbC/DsbD-like thiol-disulfide interchange protein